MKNKQSKRNLVNLIFSAFLIIAYIVCAYFFVQFAQSLEGSARVGVMAAIFAIFGLLVFYATRVGEGKAIRRFSLMTLIILDLPALYIVMASIFTFLPLGERIAKAEVMAFLAAVALGYGIPYTFLSGFELAAEEAEEAEADSEEADEVLEGGVAADLEETEEAQPEEDADEVVVEGVNADAAPEETAEESAETEETTETEDTVTTEV